jgi:hypothetical protein
MFDKKPIMIEKASTRQERDAILRSGGKPSPSRIRKRAAA